MRQKMLCFLPVSAALPALPFRRLPDDRMTMKKISSFAALLLLSSAALAQQPADSANPRSRQPRAMQYNERQLHEAEQAKKRRVLVKCRDGSKHIARVCRRHGGLA
jgi:hypothetical protein